MLRAGGQKSAEREEFARIVAATPYSLRRGGISLRLRIEDPQVVASECGTSLKMLSDHYSFAIGDLREHEPRPADAEWRAVRAAALLSRPTQEHPECISDIKLRDRRTPFVWFLARGAGCSDRVTLAS
jgi:hypothetical protein